MSGDRASRHRTVGREKAFWNARREGRYERVRGLIGRAIGSFSSYAELDDLYDPAGRDVVEYGCGQGEQAVRLVRRGARHVTAFDISEAEVAIARAAVERAEMAGSVTILVADAHATPFADATFDLVVGNSILHHLDVEAALREIRRILRPGGAAFFVEPLAHNPILRLGRALTPMARTVDEHPFTVEDWATCAREFRRFTHFERELLTIPLMPVNFVLPANRRARLAAVAHRADRWLLRRWPELARYARLTFLTLRDE